MELHSRVSAGIISIRFREDFTFWGFSGRQDGACARPPGGQDALLHDGAPKGKYEL